MPKTRLTGFSRLLLFLFVALPVVYFGASYYNGEDPVANIQSWFGNEGSDRDQTDYAPPPPSSSANAPATFENVQDLRAENERLRNDLQLRTQELARCRAGGGS